MIGKRVFGQALFPELSQDPHASQLGSSWPVYWESAAVVGPAVAAAVGFSGVFGRLWYLDVVLECSRLSYSWGAHVCLSWTYSWFEYDVVLETWIFCLLYDDDVREIGNETCVDFCF